MIKIINSKRNAFKISNLKFGYYLGFRILILGFLLLPSAASAALIIQAPKYIGLNSGLVGYWSFDGKDMAGVTAYDRSGNSNNGTLTNGPVRAIGKIGQGLSFDGSDDYISISNFCPSISNTAGTISAWVKPDVDNQATDNNDYIFNCQAGHQPSLFILGGSIPDYEFRRFTARTVATTRPRANVWVHLIATWNTSIQTIYVNGVQEDSDATVSTTQSGAGYIGIFGGTTGSWDGLIDDVRVYNRALSASEIQRLYNLGR